MLPKFLDSPEEKNPVWYFRNDFQNPKEPTTREATITGAIRPAACLMSVTQRPLPLLHLPLTSWAGSGEWTQDCHIRKTQYLPSSCMPIQTAKGDLTSPVLSTNLHASNQQNEFTPRTVAARESGKYSFQLFSLERHWSSY